VALVGNREAVLAKAAESETISNVQIVFTSPPFPLDQKEYLTNTCCDRAQ
jgi:hypothetical protein